MTSHTAAPRATEASRSEGYRPYLDGLRAVAVYLVVLFHAGADRFSGGFVGVDVFFVLSGFLVTQLLLRDLRAGGSISFRRFYSRRFRRLLPAAFVTLVVTALVFSALASPVEVTDAQGGFRAAFLYVANWHFIAQSSNYFGADLSSNPVLHFWSLAVEEQFYLLWPLLLGGLYVVSGRFGSRRWHVLRLIVVAGAVASLLWALSLRVSDPNRAYYGTDTRAYQLMAGALLALTPGLMVRLRRYAPAARALALVGVGALLVVASSWVHLDAIQRGIVVTGITVAIITALETAQGGALNRVLSLPPVVYLGQISYGTYLWHWPVIVVLTRSFDLAPLSTVAITVLIATALASLSYQLMERPIRISPFLDRWRTPVIATGLAISVASALIIIPAITNHTTTTPAAAGTNLATTGFTPVPHLNWNTIKQQLPVITDCLGKPATACTLVHGTGQHILLIGDSHAGMMIPAFTALANAHHLTLSVTVRGACPWQQNLYYSPNIVFGQLLRPEDCQRDKDDTYDRVIPALHPDIIIAMNLGRERLTADFLRYLGPDGRAHRDGSPQWQAQTTVASVARLKAIARKVVLLEPIPIPMTEVDPLTCLSTATVVEQCRYVAATTPSYLELLYRRLDKADDHVWSVDLDTLVCPYLPICDPIVNHQVVKVDRHHLTSSFVASIAPAIDDYFTKNGIIP